MLAKYEGTPKLLQYHFDSKQEAKEYVQLFLSDMCFWEQTSDRPPSPTPRKRLRTERGTRKSKSARKDNTTDGYEFAPTVTEQDLRWKPAVDPITGKTYYYDKITRETQWEKPLEIKHWERHLKREKRKKDQNFFREMERNILASLKRNQLIPGISRDDTALLGQWKTNEKLREQSLMNAECKRSIRTISGLDERVLESLNNNPQPLEQNISVPVKRSQTSRATALKSTGNETIQKGRPPLPRRRVDACELNNEMPDETRGSPGGCVEGGFKSSKENVEQKDSRVPPPLFDEQTIVQCSTHLRRNTGGTIFVRSTMINPDVKATIKCVCGVYRAHIVQGNELHRVRRPVSPNTVHVNLDIFRDDFELKRRLGIAIPVPTTEEIATFYFEYFKRSQMEHDTIIMSLIYVERLIKETNGALSPTPANWRSLLFSSMILASKVWDDLSMWNIDFSNVSVATGIAPFSLQRINYLELSVLKLLRFDVRVAASEYAKYYFLIRNVLIRSGLHVNAAAPLSKEEAKIFEHRTSRYQNVWLSDKSPKETRRSRSFDWEWFNNNASNEVLHGPVLKDTVCLEQLLSLDRHR